MSASIKTTRKAGFIVGCLFAVLIYLVVCVVSWFITCGIIKLITLCFGWYFSWSIATGIWLCMYLVRIVLNRTVNGKK